MRVSLADQPGLAIALGANLPSPVGPPLATLLAVRPLLETLLRMRALQAGAGEPAALHWSPLFRTAPVGGPPDQPDYLNAAMLVPTALPASLAEALALLAELQALERRFGRQRRERWGPRSLDLDLLWWGDLNCREPQLELPHPRLLERSFVLAPLAAIDADLRPSGAPVTVSQRLAQLRRSSGEPPPEPWLGAPDWPDGPRSPGRAVTRAAAPPGRPGLDRD